jgi:hypothetical protein
LFFELMKVCFTNNDVQPGLIAFASIGLRLGKQGLAAIKDFRDVPIAVGDKCVDIEVRTRRSKNCGQLASAG